MIGIGVRQNRIGFGGVTPPPVDTRHIMKWTLVDAGDLVVTLWGQSGAGANYSYDVDWGIVAQIQG